MHPRIAELLDYVDAQRTNLRTVVDAIPSWKYDRTPPGGGWTIRDVLEHLSIVEPRIATVIRQTTTEARTTGVALETETDSILRSINLNEFLDRSRRIDAPNGIKPTSNLQLPALWDALAASRTELRDAAMAADGLALGALSFPHRIFGPMDLYTWIAFVGAHETRHADQIREIGASLDALA